MYLDAIKSFPTSETKLQTEKGNAFHIKTDVFKRQMWFMYDDGGGMVALTPERVKEISQLNAKGKKPAELKDYQEETAVIREPNYNNVDDQDSLSRFDDKFSKNKKRKKKKKPGQRPEGEATAQTVQQDRGPKPQRPPRDQQKPRENNGEQAQRNRPPKGQNRPAPAEGQVNPAAASGEEKKPNKRRNNRRRPPRQNSNQNENKTV